MADGDLTPWMVRFATCQGFFPMASDEPGREHGVEWFSTRRRAIFPGVQMHVSRSLARTLRRGRFEVRFDTAFEAVIRGCVRPPGENWLSEEIIRVYVQIHHEGWAHSAEVWQEGELVGGVYGLALGACFSAESMFSRRTDASKVALHALLERCRELGFELFDAQFLNEHTASLGAIEIPQKQYLKLLERALRQKTDWDRSAYREGFP